MFGAFDCLRERRGEGSRGTRAGERRGTRKNSYAIGSVLRGCYKLGSRGVGLGLQVHGIRCLGITTQSSSEHLMLEDAAVRSNSYQEDLCPSQLRDADASTSGGNTSYANDETSMNDSLMMVVCEQRAPEDEIAKRMWNWNYTALVDAIHNGEGKCWTTKIHCEKDLVKAMETGMGEKKIIFASLK
ncbi:hypothetical protein AgCh_025591 [Apium graveolens]